VVAWLDKLKSRLSEIEKSLRARPATARLMEQLRERAAKRFDQGWQVESPW
jgi:hypothetical protein